MDEILDYTERLTRAIALRAARRRMVVRGLDRRRRHRLRQADPALRDVPQGGRLARGRLDGDVAAGQGRHQQHGVVHEGGDLHVPQVRARARRALQRRLLPRHRGDRAARHHRQRRPARGVRRPRSHRLPHARHVLRRARPDAAGPLDRRVRGRQHRRVDRRLRPGPPAVHLRRVHLLGVGRPRVGGRPRRQRQHAREHVAAARGDHRGGAAAADPLHRVHPGRRRPREVPRRHVDPPRLQAARRGSGAAGAGGSPRLPSVRALRGPARAVRPATC